jgi:hypothetical protein
MATSPIYNWPEPDNTDLVKNGALAIRTLGDAIDTTMGTMVAKTVVDAKGDLIAGTAADTVNRLAVGNNGDTLVADSSTSTGLRWQSDRAGAKNGLINSAFDVSQRGSTITGIASDNIYTADRWYVARGGNLDYALKTVAGGNNPPTSFDAYGQYINQSAANPFINVIQTLETKDSIRFAGTAAATLSFWARATANTVKSKSITAAIGYNTTADTKINTLVGTTTFTTAFGTASTDWTFCTLTVGIPSTAKTVGAYFSQAPAGGLAVGDGFEITGVQLERAAVATAFQRNAGTIQGELAACQRYYVRNSGPGAYSFYGYGLGTSLTNVSFAVNVPVPMRVVPTSVDFSTLGNYRPGAVNAISALAIDVGSSSTQVAAVNATSTAVSGTFYQLSNNNSTSGYIGFSAEI